MRLWLAILALWLAVMSVDFFSTGAVALREEPVRAVAHPLWTGASTQDKDRVEINRPRPDDSPSTSIRPEEDRATIGPVYPVVTATLSPTATPTPIRGEATWYGGPAFAGKPMRNGDPYNEWDPTTAASNVFPMGTELEVTYSKTITVTVKDTGDFAHEVDLSRQAFYNLVRSNEPGRIKVDIRVVGP